MLRGIASYFCRIGVFVALALPSFSLGQPRPEPLRELAEHYRSVLSVNMFAEATTSDGSNIAIDISVDDTGAFAALYFGDVYGFPGVTWDERPWYFVYFDGHYSYGASDTGSSYERTIPDAAYVQYPPPVHQVFAPWPVVSKWADALADADDTEVVVSGGERSARSMSLGIAIRWDEKMRILAVFRASGEGDAGTEILFEAYDAQPGRAARPSRMRQINRIQTQESDDTMRIDETKYVITRFEFNPSDIAERLVFDAEKLQVNRFDRLTGNMYSPSGNLLFNKNEVYKAYLAAKSTRRFRPWMIVVLVSLFLGSGYIAYRRFGPRLVGGDGGNKA